MSYKYIKIFSVIAVLITGSLIFAMDNSYEKLFNDMNNVLAERNLTPLPTAVLAPKQAPKNTAAATTPTASEPLNPVTLKKVSAPSSQPEVRHSKFNNKVIISLLSGLGISAFIGLSFGFYKATPQIRTKIKKYQTRVTAWISAKFAPASIATEDQTPSWATIHQS